MSDATDPGATTEITPFNQLPPREARAGLMACLAVPRWADTVLGGRPYAGLPALLAAAGEAAGHLTDDELTAALAGHPRIGERATGPHQHAELSAREQSGVDPSDAQLATELAAGNADYEERFDRVFLIRAAGRTAPEILAELRRRLANGDDAERTETIAQLREIALLRLREMAR